MLDFLANNWPYILAVVLVVLAVFAFRGLRKALKEGGGAFSLATIRKNSEPNFAALKQKSKALLADADMICETKENSNFVIPSKEDMKFFRRAVSQKYKLAMFLIPGTNKVVYFFCKTEAGLRRRIENLVINQKFREGKPPYMDVPTGEKLKYPKA
ncbi:MAG: hypothetical protein MJY78_02375 [Fibrobacter sp.]|nr:hypothetical protein [Fibrobacter sp.]MCQ2120661.1 hypothetical protein [Fibrobacter sp.]